MEEPQKHSMRKKLDVRGHKMYGSIQMKYPEKVNIQRQKVGQ